MSDHHLADEDEFFKKRSPASAKKTLIVVKFFKSWGIIMQKYSQRLLYIDLYAGPGSYEEDENGVANTVEKPIFGTCTQILMAAAADLRLSTSLIAILNEGSSVYAKQLEALLDSLPQIASMKFKPRVFCGMVNDNIADAMSVQRLVPSLLFADPFGYAGLTQKLVRSTLKDWGSDCVFFFNYSRVNRVFSEASVAKHIDALFTRERSEEMRQHLAALDDPVEREDYILKGLTDAMADIGGKYPIGYRFRTLDGRTSHYLMFVSKKPIGYDVMKKHMASESEVTDDDIPTYEFMEPGEKPALFNFPPRRFPWSIDRLKQDLRKTYAGTPTSFQAIYDHHNIGKPYIEKNYRAAIIALQAHGLADLRKPDGSAVRRNSCPADTIVRFK
jgi:three-Cys-motif partner protein